jgi:predicted Rossmann fold nucleotide-binding protein DprA/Smf involved in DNA uptake
MYETGRSIGTLHFNFDDIYKAKNIFQIKKLNNGAIMVSEQRPHSKPQGQRRVVTFDALTLRKIGR